MENLVKDYLNIYRGKKVFLTGHTGFKGSWTAYWLTQLGAEVIGFSLPPKTEPNHFSLLNLGIKEYFHDISDLDFLQKAVDDSHPDIIFHLAAQPLVRYSYKNPIETYQTNVMGTVNILEAARINGKVKAVVLITTDKCYENVEQEKGYTETDRMGGYDPYSSSKGCAELIINAYRNSYFNTASYKQTHETLIASARAGNVIGGGDWSEDRLIPDIIKSTVNGIPTIVRSPNATRPWQHVLEPISGYLMLGYRLLNGEPDFAEGWNFGPEEHEVLTVKSVLEIAAENWDAIQYKIEESAANPHEAKLLSLNIEKAKTRLGWTPKWSNEISIKNTIEWYKEFYTNGKINTESNLKNYIDLI
jgi:CDP-glucose 4,6-dehydratase